MKKWQIANQLKPVVCDCGVEITPETRPADHRQNCIVSLTARVRELEQQVERYEKALRQIRDMDYRGHPHQSAAIARTALKEEK